MSELEGRTPSYSYSELADQMLPHQANIRIIEANRERAEDLAARYPHYDIVHGDATDASVLNSEFEFSPPETWPRLDVAQVAKVATTRPDDQSSFDIAPHWGEQDALPGK